MMMSSAALASGNERGNDEENVVDVSATSKFVEVQDVSNN